MKDIEKRKYSIKNLYFVKLAVLEKKQLENMPVFYFSYKIQNFTFIANRDKRDDYSYYKRYYYTVPSIHKSKIVDSVNEFNKSGDLLIKELTPFTDLVKTKKRKLNYNKILEIEKKVTRRANSQSDLNDPKEDDQDYEIIDLD